jgi:hypothetical protein
MQKDNHMKYATVMTTGLLVNISIFASDMAPTERYADLMESKQRIIRQLNKQAECVRLANDEQQLKACQSALSRMALNPIEKEKVARNAQKSKADNLNETEFF